jgi:uncharacterized protein (DUF2141 family)
MTEWNFQGILSTSVALSACLVATAVPAHAKYRQKIETDLSRCHREAGSALTVTVGGIESSHGAIRVQNYRAVRSDWLEKGRWINRIETPAHRGTMTFCLPVPGTGNYAVAVRHDVNGNRKTDITQDGGGMSNNPSINIFNLGLPSYKKTRVSVAEHVKSIRITMKYM